MGLVSRAHRRSPLALAILSLLKVEPMHPYRMQQLIKQWGKDEVINVEPRASLYKMIERLRNTGLIAVLNTERDSQWPERTVYEITAEGDAVSAEWLRDMLSDPRKSFAEFPAAVSFIPLLEPAEAITRLEARAVRLRAEADRLTAGIEASAPAVPAVSLLDAEYLLAVASAEARWVDAVLTELRAGRLTWTQEGLRAVTESQGDGLATR
jgi:DNA-binding PadR family transcriptional regulator